MIEFDESELLHSDVTDTTLQFIAEYCGPEIRDRLLYKVVNYVEFYSVPPG